MNKKEIITVFLISILTYLFFFHPLLNPHKLIYSGKDVSDFHYPSRLYFAESLERGNFPFWTERIHSGYPISADLERGFMNILNVLLIALTGPFLSYKILHFLTYLTGSLALYLLLKKLGSDIKGFFIGNLIYYFNFFMLYHQQHLNMVMTAYLFPLLILLTHLFIQKNQIKWIYLKGLMLAYLFSMGSFQILSLFIFVDIIYFFVFSKKPFIIKKSLIYFFSIYIFFLSLSLPLLASQAQLFIQSERSDQTLFTQGSFYPVMLINTVYPFVFDKGDSYFGINLNSNMYIQETYIFLGISTLFVALYFSFHTKRKELAIFLFLCLLIFIVLGTVKSIPYSETHVLDWLFFPFSLFRYWVRSIIVVIFAAVLVIAPGLSEYSKKRSPILTILKKLYLFLVIYLLLLQLFNLNTEVLTYTVIFIKNIGVFDPTNIILFLILLICVFALFSKNLKVDTRRTIIMVLIVFEITFFWYYSGSILFKNSNEFNFKKVTYPIPQKSRVVDLTGKITSENYLIQEYWSPLGYSVFNKKSLANNMYTAGFDSLRYPQVKDNEDMEKIYKNLADLGVEYVIEPSGSIRKIDTDLVDIDHYDLERQEGYLSFYANLKDYKTIETKLNYYLGWTAYINNKRIKLSNNNDGFISIGPIDTLDLTDRELDNAHVEIRYLPIPFIFGSVLSGLLIPASIVMIGTMHKNAGKIKRHI